MQIIHVQTQCSIADCQGSQVQAECEKEGLPVSVFERVFGGCGCHCDCYFYLNNPSACQSNCWAIGKEPDPKIISGCHHCLCKCPENSECQGFCADQGKVVASVRGSSDCACQCEDRSPVCPEYNPNTCPTHCQTEGKSPAIKQVDGCTQCDCRCPPIDAAICNSQCSQKEMVSTGSTMDQDSGCEVCHCQCEPYNSQQCQTHCFNEGLIFGGSKVLNNGCEVCDCQSCLQYDDPTCKIECQAKGMIYGKATNNQGCMECACEQAAQGPQLPQNPQVPQAPQCPICPKLCPEGEASVEAGQDINNCKTCICKHEVSSTHGANFPDITTPVNASTGLPPDSIRIGKFKEDSTGSFSGIVCSNCM